MYIYFILFTNNIYVILYIYIYICISYSVRRTLRARNIIMGSYSLKSKNVLPTKTEGETSTSGLAIFLAREEDFPPEGRKERGERDSSRFKANSWRSSEMIRRN